MYFPHLMSNIELSTYFIWGYLQWNHFHRKNKNLCNSNAADILWIFLWAWVTQNTPKCGKYTYICTDIKSRIKRITSLFFFMGVKSTLNSLNVWKKNDWNFVMTFQSYMYYKTDPGYEKCIKSFFYWSLGLPFASIYWESTYHPCHRPQNVSTFIDVALIQRPRAGNKGQ